MTICPKEESAGYKDKGTSFILGSVPPHPSLPLVL